MSSRSRIVVAVTHLAIAAIAINVGTSLVPSPASAALGDCSQPSTNGPNPTATDCLFILQASVALVSCNPECICAPKGNLPVAATDALICIRYSVGQPVVLDCPCAPSTTTSTTTTTTLGGGGTTTTTTLDGGAVACSFDSTACTATPCTCFGVADGFDYHLGATGQVSGPVGTELRINTLPTQGGTIDCGDWTRIDSSVNPSCDILGCCQRQGGDPETTAWIVDQAMDLPCFCPELPAPLEHEFDIQCQLGTDPVVEHFQTTTPCP